MKITFTERNEKGLHCRFCHETYIERWNTKLYETKPIKGIVCKSCKEHLKDYL